VKVKACRHCEAAFTPARPMQVVCSPICAARKVKADKAAEKAQIKARKEAIKTYSEWKADAQKAVNEYVRLRDQGKPCISCQKPWDATFQAGHYRSRGAAPQLALDPRNIAGQCVQCNLHKHGNQAAFRLGLIEREGVAHVEAIESENEPLKLSVDELRQLKVIHKGLARELKRSNA
jgi:hypothetical protein